MTAPIPVIFGEAAPTTEASPTLDSITLGSNLVSSKLVKVSVQLEQDSAFDIASMLNDAFAKRNPPCYRADVPHGKWFGTANWFAYCTRHGRRHSDSCPRCKQEQR